MSGGVRLAGGLHRLVLSAPEGPGTARAVPRRRQAAGGQVCAPRRLRPPAPGGLRLRQRGAGRRAGLRVAGGGAVDVAAATVAFLPADDGDDAGRGDGGRTGGAAVHLRRGAGGGDAGRAASVLAAGCQRAGPRAGGAVPGAALRVPAAGAHCADRRRSAESDAEARLHALRVRAVHGQWQWRAVRGAERRGRVAACRR